MEGFLTSRDIAQLLKVHIITVRRYIKAGKLPAVFLGKEYRVKKEDFERFLDKMRIRGRATS